MLLTAITQLYWEYLERAVEEYTQCIPPLSPNPLCTYTTFTSVYTVQPSNQEGDTFQENYQPPFPVPILFYNNPQSEILHHRYCILFVQIVCTPDFAGEVQFSIELLKKEGMDSWMLQSISQFIHFI